MTGTLETAGAITNSGAVTNSAAVTNSLGVTNSSAVVNTLQTAGSSDSSITGYGVTHINDATTGQTSFLLAAPAAGVEKTIFYQPNAAITTSSSAWRSVYVASAVGILSSGSTATQKMRFKTFGDYVKLIGLSATQYGIVSLPGSTGFATANSTTTT